MLKGKKIVLASASPRRQKLFKMIGLNALKLPSMVDERNNWKNPAKFVMAAAEKKALSVAKTMDRDCVIVAADTIVYHNHNILGKPTDRYEAADFLKELSGNEHFVYTGVCIISSCSPLKKETNFEKTKVVFKELSNKEISDYIETKEPMDKAGAYGIQGFGSQFIKKISGCYFNVMGFPIPLFYKMLEKIFQNQI